ncbi:MAG: hypothetical protein Q7S95_02650 [bacterium]|nr:hypothetical protein [bacterium]
MRLLDFLFPPRLDEALLREVRLADFLEKLSPQLIPSTRPPSVALLPYSDSSVRAAIHEAKYHGSEHAFSLLAEALADFLPDYLGDSFDANVRRTTSYISIVPVPLGKERRRERGYNQVEEVAKRTLKLLDMPGIRLDTSLLRRTRETATQVSLERKAREENMRGAFRATHAANPTYLYIVLDDVLTTGATLASCLDALVAEGVPRDQLLPLALAH